jgi:hypothetical protein
MTDEYAITIRLYTKSKIRFWLRHQFWDFLRIFGLRDRKRCPACTAVGTYKPHGGWLEGVKGPRRRWLCKWCGLYENDEFITVARPVFVLQ